MKKMNGFKLNQKEAILVIFSIYIFPFLSTSFLTSIFFIIGNVTYRTNI